jgi:hypothetical protein
LTNAAGCDSVITLNLTLNEYPDSSVQQSGLTLTANTTGAVYQWLDCDNAFNQISGENGQSFTASSSGSYAVQITENGCSSISECINLTVSGNQWNPNPFRYRLYPNPSRGQAILEIFDNLSSVNIKVINCLGQIIKEEYCGNSNLIEHNLYLSELPAGTYFIQIHTADRVFTERLAVTNDN